MILEVQDEVAQSSEMCVIGSILIDEKALVNVVDTLKTEHFFLMNLKTATKQF